LPPGPNGEKVGLDDFLAEKGEAGPEALRQLLRDARPPSAEPERLTGRALYRVFMEESARKVSPAAALLWCQLWNVAEGDRASLPQTPGKVSPGLTGLLGKSKRQVQRLLVELEEKGLVVCPDHLHGDNLRGKASVYFLRGRIREAAAGGPPE
jgi:hypothetical protein